MFSICCYFFIFVFVLFVSVLFADLLAYFDIYFHTDSRGMIVYSPPKLRLKGTRIILLSIHSNTPIFLSSPHLNRIKMLRKIWHIQLQVQHALQVSTVALSDLKTQLHSKFLDHCCSFVYLLYCCAACCCHCSTHVCVCCSHLPLYSQAKAISLNPLHSTQYPLLPPLLPLLAVSYTVRLKCALIVLLHCLQWHFTAVASRCRVCLRLCVCACVRVYVCVPFNALK